MSDDFDPGTISWVMDEADLDHLRLVLGECEEIVFDLETTGLDEHATHGGRSNGGVSARVSLAQFTLPHPDDAGDPTTFVLPLSHPDSPWRTSWRRVLTEIAEFIALCEKPLVGQNVKFDTRWIAGTTGVSLSHLIAWDTRISSHLLDENRPTSLKKRAPETFGIPPWNDHDLTYPGASEDVPLIELGLYGARDTYWTWRLAQNHRHRMNLLDPEEPIGPEEIEEARLGRLATHVAMPTIASLGLIEERGIALDTVWIERTYLSHETTRADLRERLIGRYDLPGDPSFAPTSKWFMAWADAAVDAGDLRVAELTPTGKPRWSKAVLTRQSRRGYEVATDLLELRGVEKRMEYMRSWLAKCSAAGRIHTTYNAGSVVTGRLSSNDPNMQQVTGLLKPAFIADTGKVFVDLDFSQIELRVAAFLSRSEAMLTAFRNGDDLHTRLASAIVNKPESEITKAERQAGKSANFGLLYGMGARGFREYAESVYDVMFTEEEAARVHETYFETWDKLREWHLRTVDRVRREGQVISPLGRLRRLPDVWDGNDERAAAAERAAINAPVQGLASDLMQMAAASINGVLPGISPVMGAEIVGTVHDSILIEVPRSDWEAVGRECQQRMETIATLLPDFFGFEFDVPLKADGMASRRWGGEAIGEF